MPSVFVRRVLTPTQTLGMLAIFSLSGCSGCKHQEPETKAAIVAPGETDSGIALEIPYPSAGVTLGSGWNSMLGRPTAGTCVDAIETRDSGQTKEAVMKTVTDTNSLMEQLNVSVSLQLQGIVGRVSGKAEFAKTVEINDENVNFVVDARVWNGLRRLTFPPSGTLDINKNLRSLSVPEFLSRCGDSFVSAIKDGAEISAVYTFHTHDASERQKLHSELSGSGWGIEGKAALAQESAKYTSNSALQIQYRQSGGSGTPIPTTQEQLIDLVRGLPSTAAAGPSSISIWIQRYDSLPGWNKARYAWVSSQAAPITAQYGRFTSLYQQVVHIRQHPETVVLDEIHTLKDVKDVENRLHDHLVSLEHAANQCLRTESKQCAIREEDRKSDYLYRAQLPALSGTFPEAALVRDIPPQLEAAKASIAKIKHDSELATVLAGGSGLAPCSSWSPCAGAEAKVNSLSAALTNASQTYRESERKAIRLQWIEIASDFRCDSGGVTDPGCLKPEDVDRWAATIKDAQ